MASNLQVGRYLALLRERAGLKQNELAQKVTWSPTVLSRVESGGRSISQDELVSILEAIGTEESLNFAQTSDRNWEHLPEPHLGHPDEQPLWHAEQALKSIVELSNAPDIKNVFVKRLDEYRSALCRAADLVIGTEYTIAFIGELGVGKSTAICKAADLEVQEAQKLEPVLESGAGGVTICEVHLVQGPQYGILVEPVSENELRREVSEFAQYLMRPSQSGEETGSADQETHGTSKEIERAIRNMSGLRNVRVRKEDGSRQTVDHARNLTQEFKSGGRDANALTIEVLSRINLHLRTRRDMWYSEMSGKTPLCWLRDIFLEVNNGRHPEFSLPKRIEVIVPKPILEEASLSIRLVDTKGIDGNAEREDLEFHLNEPNSIALLCSRFNDAPSIMAQQLLDRALQGQFPDIGTKAAVLVLPRPEEALAVKTDQGESAEDAEDGYELKGEQARMILESRNFPNAGVEFFNVREDSVERFNTFLLGLVRNLRTLHVQRLNEVVVEANALVANFDREQKSETLKAAAHRLTVWIDGNSELEPSPRPLEASLLGNIGNVYASSVRASVRRQGAWDKLDYPYQLGYGTRVKASRVMLRKQQDFSATVKNILDDPEMEEAYGLAQQAQRLFDTGIETLLRNSHQMGVSIHTDDMQSDSSFWSKCEDRWGKGPGYRNDVLDINKKWFETNRAKVDAKVEDIVGREWEQILNRLSDILIFE